MAWLTRPLSRRWIEIQAHRGNPMTHTKHDMAKRWIILRTSGRCTLPLAASLKRDGYDVWTPVHVRRVRLPRHNVRRVIMEPLLKGFVFAASGQMGELALLSHTLSRHAKFSVVREFGEIAEVADRQLDGLRWIEGRVNVAAKKTEQAIPIGVEVKVGSGLFGGMTGVVRRSKRGLTLVCFNDRYSAEIPTSLLKIDGAYGLESAIGGIAALAA